MNQQANDPFFIIMVDDDEEDIYTMRRAFSSLDAEIRFTAVSTSEAFFDLIEGRDTSIDRDPDLVLLDLNIPTVSGFEILDLLRHGGAEGKSNLVPVVILSTSDAAEDAVRCYLSGANAVFTKATNFEGTVRIAKAVYEFWRTEGIRRIGRIPARS